MIEDERRNFLNTAEILDLEILNIDAGIKDLLDLKQQLDEALRVENPAIEQICVG